VATDVVYWWSHYSDIFMFAFGASCILLVVSTVLVLRRLTLLLGHEMRNKINLIRWTVTIFCFAFIVRVFTSVALHFRKSYLIRIFRDDSVYFVSFCLLVWVVYDLIPICFLFAIHKRNFASFDLDQERMICEGTVEDTASNVSELITPLQFSKLLQPKKRKFAPPGSIDTRT